MKKIVLGTLLLLFSIVIHAQPTTSENQDGSRFGVKKMMLGISPIDAVKNIYPNISNGDAQNLLNSNCQKDPQLEVVQCAMGDNDFRNVFTVLNEKPEHMIMYFGQGQLLKLRISINHPTFTTLNSYIDEYINSFSKKYNLQPTTNAQDKFLNFDNFAFEKEEAINQCSLIALRLYTDYKELDIPEIRKQQSGEGQRFYTGNDKFSETYGQVKRLCEGYFNNGMTGNDIKDPVPELKKLKSDLENFEKTKPQKNSCRNCSVEVIVSTFGDSKSQNYSEITYLRKKLTGQKMNLIIDITNSEAINKMLNARKTDINNFSIKKNNDF